MFIHANQPDYQELKSRTIDGKRYYTTPDGNKYASITTILGTEEKPWLNKWRESMGSKRADKETKRCADRGTAVHNMAEQFLNNNPDHKKNYSTSDIKLFNKLSYSLKRINNIRALEIPMYSDKLKTAGRCDCIAEYNGVLSVIDFKTSTSPKNKDMIEDYFLQISGYAYMFYELFDIFIEQGVILIAVEKGLVPAVFKFNTKDYIEPLVTRINSFYK